MNGGHEALDLTLRIRRGQFSSWPPVRFTIGERCYRVLASEYRVPQNGRQ
jgi:hypothetical protein